MTEATIENRGPASIRGEEHEEEQVQPDTPELETDGHDDHADEEQDDALEAGE